MERNRPETGEVWRHYKGSYAAIAGVAQHTETGELEVVYWDKGSLWVRPFDLFMGVVSDDEGTNLYRFEKLY